MSNGVVMGFGGISTDYFAYNYYGVVSDQEHGHNSLWQETNQQHMIK